jgi:unsaturated rhamnogalacturonyl hydrolase
MRAHPPEELAWSWGEGVLAYGLMRLHQATGQPSLRDYVARYVRVSQARDVRIAWSDDTTPGLSAAELVLAGDASARPILDRVVDYVMTAPRSEAQGMILHLGRRVPRWLAPRGLFPDVWVDSLFHVTITLCRYSRIRADPRYRDEAAQQLSRFLTNLQDPASGLVTHAYNDRPRDRQVPPFEQAAFWARGNGWALVSLVEVLAELPPDHPLRAELVERVRRLAAALRKLAEPSDGLFHTLLLDRDSYRETAGSALIVYGLARGVRAGLLGEADSLLARRGMRGLIGVLESHPSGVEVTDTSLGTNPNARRYKTIRRKNQVSYGVGAWLLAASELLELDRLSPVRPL